MSRRRREQTPQEMDEDARTRWEEWRAWDTSSWDAKHDEDARRTFLDLVEVVEKLKERVVTLEHDITEAAEIAREQEDR